MSEVMEAIAARRSIRRFRPDPLPEDTVREILRAATLAPSGKNRQPWRFVVVQGEQRAAMIEVMDKGIAEMESRGEGFGSAKGTREAMAQAPVTVFVYRPGGLHPWLAHSIEQNFWEVVDVQSIGAAIQNMLLAAHSLGVGSLWICDIFTAYEGFGAWLGEEGQLVAAVSLGYADEEPSARPRKSIEDVTRWL